MSRIPDIGDRPVEHDPTGVRALLGGLPDPGPMPPDLVARITAALGAEAAMAEAPSDHSTRPALSVIPLAAGRASRGDGILDGQTRKDRRRALLPWLTAAAAAGIVTVAGTNLLHDHGGSILASFQGESSAGSAAMSSSAASGLAGGSVDSTDRGAHAASSVVTVHRTGASYTVVDLPQQAARMAAAAASTEDSPVVGGLGSAAGAQGCAVSHGVDPTAPLAVDLGSIDGTPGIVVVAGSGSGRTAYAFSMSCEVLAGPVALP